jgi:hypothetical protein
MFSTRINPNSYKDKLTLLKTPVVYPEVVDRFIVHAPVVTIKNKEDHSDRQFIITIPSKQARAHGLKHGTRLILDISVEAEPE